MGDLGQKILKAHLTELCCSRPEKYGLGQKILKAHLTELCCSRPEKYGLERLPMSRNRIYGFSR